MPVPRRRERSTAQRTRRRSPQFPFLLFATLGAAAVAAGVFLFTPAGASCAYLAGINVATFTNYAYDKAGSSRDWARIPERVLHFLASAGGTPAAFLAQRLLRHKTLKRPFQVRFWIIVAVQLVAVAAYAGWRLRGG